MPFAGFPNASKPTEPETLKGGASSDLALNNYEIAGDQYQVCFYFKAAKLVQVMLSSKSPSRPQFDSVVELLRSKYGQELGSGKPQCEPGEMMTKCEADWSLKTGTNVGVFFMDIGGSGVLNIYYQTRIASDASKL